ncbi:MAG: hypothetical protein LQ339_008149 [Xanthoria mediterranea]|nr:MAG: hypothetical protein LQ339_008149 [Xanthoria mediterranea]
MAMNFAIEVAGEANPLSLQTLYHTLTAASSSDPQQIKSGAQQLRNWENQSGYYSSLQSIFTDASMPIQVRHLCIIQLKNGIDKYWRKRALNAIGQDEKDLIRSRSVESGTNEPDHCLALQNALMIAKIVRYEYPQEWPDAVSSIVSNLRKAFQSDGNLLKLTRALLILLEVIKELSTARIQRTRTNLQAASVEVLQVLGKIYVDRVQIWMTFFRQGGDDEGGAISSVEQSLLALRVLRRLLIAGWDFPNRSTEVREFWSLLSSHFRDMLSMAVNDPSSLHENVRRLIEKHLRQIAKLHVDLAKAHPSGFTLLPSSVQLVSAYWNLVLQFGETYGSQSSTAFDPNNGRSEEDHEITITEYLSLKGLLLLRACVKMVFNPAQTFKYQQAEDKEEKAQSREMIKENILTANFAEAAMQALVTRFFVFTQRDLRDWEEEPEEWQRREEGEDDTWEFSIRPCAEKLFLELMFNYKQQLVQPLLSVFGTVANPQNRDVLQKDSIYGAIGLAASVLEDKLDFNSFLRGTLSQEVQIDQPGCGILRRRIAIILGQWLPVKDGLDRALVYQIFQHLLDKGDPSNDLVVRITAGRQLKNVIIPFDFRFEQFEPYATTVLHRLVALIEEVELNEIKLALLNTLLVLIQSVEEKESGTDIANQIVPFADQIISVLAPLWEQAGSEFLLKQSILGILSSLISAVRGESRKYHALFIPLIDSSVDVTSETYLYMVEDALDLWVNVLQQTPSNAVSDVVSLVPRLFPMLEVGSDTLRKALEIAEMYVYMAPVQMLASTGPMLSPLTSLLKGSKREVTGLVLSIVELLMQSALRLGGSENFTSFTLQLLDANLIQTVMSGLRGAHEAHQTTGPHRAKTWLDVLVETDYLCILARLALASPNLFIDAVKAATPNEQFETTVSWLLSEWFRHLDNISHPEKKKLNCLAVTALLQTGQPWILEHLQELMTVWTEIVVELYDNDERQDDCLVYWDVKAMKGANETAEVEGQRKLMFADPVHRVDLKPFIREHIQYAIASSGGSNEAFEEQWVVNVDKDVLQGFSKLGIF